MINILFWNTNINKNDLENGKVQRINDIIIELLKEHDIRIAIFSEYITDLQILCDAFSDKNYKVALVGEKSRVKMMFSADFHVELIRDSDYYFIFSVKNVFTDFLLAGLHLPSKIHANSNDQQVVIQQFLSDLGEAKKEVGHQRVIVTGDFNANPFETMMWQANEFHALPDADLVAEKKRRKVYGKPYQIYYNPMWNFLGDFKFPNMTYYYDHGGALNLYNNIFDQVLISADMLPDFNKTETKIIVETESDELIKDKIPKNKEYSDHLPIMFSIKEDI